MHLPELATSTAVRAVLLGVGGFFLVTAYHGFEAVVEGGVVLSELDFMLQFGASAVLGGFCCWRGVRRDNDLIEAIHAGLKRIRSNSERYHAQAGVLERKQITAEESVRGTEMADP